MIIGLEDETIALRRAEILPHGAINCYLITFQSHGLITQTGLPGLTAQVWFQCEGKQ